MCRDSVRCEGPLSHRCRLFLLLALCSPPWGSVNNCLSDNPQPCAQKVLRTLVSQKNVFCVHVQWCLKFQHANSSWGTSPLGILPTNLWSFTLEGYTHSNKPALQRFVVHANILWRVLWDGPSISVKEGWTGKRWEKVPWKVVVFLEPILPFYLEHITFKTPFHFKDIKIRNDIISKVFPRKGQKYL